jgi:hypothetical protein
MECEVCNRKTRINWGNSEHILCEEHFGTELSPSDLQKHSIETVNPRLWAKVFIVGIFIIELLLLPLWWVMFVLSVPGNGASNGYYLMVAPFAGYPVFILFFLVLSIVFYNKYKKYLASVVSILMPLVISFGYLSALSPHL